MNKIDRLLDAMEHPEHYTDEELDVMLQDPELREIYDVMSKTKDALYTAPEPDIDEEWRKFASAHQLESPDSSSKPKFLMYFTRHAAAIIIGVVVSFAAVAAGIGIKAKFDKQTESSSATEMTEPVVKTEPAVADSLVTVGATPEVIIFKEETLGQILESVAAYYDAQLVVNSSDSQNLRLYFRWDKNQELAEVIETLNNFEHIHIELKDNTITIE